MWMAVNQTFSGRWLACMIVPAVTEVCRRQAAHSQVNALVFSAQPFAPPQPGSSGNRAVPRTGRARAVGHASSGSTCWNITGTLAPAQASAPTSCAAGAKGRSPMTKSGETFLSPEKFTEDLTNKLKDYRLAGINFEAIVAGQRRNVEALANASR